MSSDGEVLSNGSRREVGPFAPLRELSPLPAHWRAPFPARLFIKLDTSGPARPWLIAPAQA